MKILIDVMGADREPAELLAGAYAAATEYGVEIAVVGDEAIIREKAGELGIPLDRISVTPSQDVIHMEDSPLSVTRQKSQSSMAVGLRSLAAGEADAFVSAGNTGALLTGGTLIVRRIRGIARAAIGTVLPLSSPVLLIDSGANLEVTPEQLEQFAYMGSNYMTGLYGIESPRIGLLNNGAEPTKGLTLQKETYERLSASHAVSFVGNVESAMLPFGVCDVIVTDGFTGNIVLKYTEGLGKYFAGCVKEMFLATPFTKLSALVMKKQLRSFKQRFNASEHGGAPLLGLAKPVIKAHGNSDAKAIKNAVRQSIRFSESGFTRNVAEYAKSFIQSKENGIPESES